MTILDQIKANASYLLQTKNLIREAINEQGVEVPENTPFEAYPQLVAQIGGGVDYRPPTPRRNGTIAGELGQILDTKKRLREVIAQYNDVITEQTPFREYAQLIRDIVTAPTLAGLKEALNAGTAAEKYPIGTEIDDEWNGQSNPLIVAHYTNITLADGTVKPGAYLARKYVEPVDKAYGYSGTTYTNSAIRSYLGNEYFEKCSTEAKRLVADIKVGVGSAASNGKFFLMSSTEVLGVLVGGETPWDYWKEKTGLSGSGMTGYSTAANPGRIVTNRDGSAKPAWLRNVSSNSASVITVNGSIMSAAVTTTSGVLPACAVVAD